MEKAKYNEIVREEEEANNSSMSFSALLKDVVNVLNFMDRLKNEKDQIAADVADQIENLKFVLAFICTYVQLSYFNLEKFEDTMNAAKIEVKDLLRSILDDVHNNIGCKYNYMNHTLPSLANNMDDCIGSCQRSKSSAIITEEQLNFLLLNLHHISKFLAEKVYPYEILQNVCGNMRDFHGLIVNGCVEQEIVEYVLPQFQPMAERVGLFLWDETISEDSQVFKLAHLFLKIFPIELEVMHICFTNLETSTSAEVERFIKKLLETSPDMLREYLIHLQEHMVNVTTTSISGARNIHIMIEFLLIILSDMPKDLIHHDKLFDLLARVGALTREEEIGLVKQDLEFIRSFFVNDEQELYKDLWARVLDVAYEAKDVIDSIIVRDNGLLHLIFSLPITIKKIKLIKEDISNLLEKAPKNRSLIVVNSPKKSVESKSLTTGKIIVGFEEETNWIIRKLTSGLADLDVISITGMPGSGKTTLAYKVYNDKSVSSHFDLRAWCTVGQEYEEKKLLHKIFNQVSDLDSKLSENIDVADMLRKQLFGKRYLIVIDDVWDTTTWDDLTRPFPTVDKGSRIILTTRELEVALHGKRNTDPLNLRLLRPEESWELFEKRAFGKESCPDELLNVGKELAQNCKGLPLVADLIAGVVARKEKKKTVWLEVRNNLSSFILNSEVEVMKVIELSYDHLPNHLKPCFLYLARFPKDSPILILALKDFWRAEGLVEQTEMKSVEEVMDVYLDNLISSSLVFLFNDIGDHPTCRLHDLVHDFCLMKAKKEKLFDRISSSAPPSSSDLMLRIVTIDCNSEFFLLNNFVLFGSNKIRHSSKHLYSLRIVGDKLDDRLSDICHLRHLRLLRVLYLDPSFIKVKDSLLNEICMLNHLRFLCIGTEVKSLPTSLSNLWNLETLLVSNIGSTLVLLPRIWDLVKLRVLFMSACSFFDLNSDEPILIAEDTKLENLRQLENLELSYSKDAEDIFKRFPNLQGLAFRLKESWDYSTEGYWFPKLDFLTELEDLRIVFESSNTNDSGPSVATNRPWDFHFPASLKSLWLGVFPLSSDLLSIIARLPNLENLTLKNTIIQGEEWNMGEEDTFENLKFLELDEVALAKWEVGDFQIFELSFFLKIKCRTEFPLPVHQLLRLKMNPQTSIAFSQLFYAVLVSCIAIVIARLLFNLAYSFKISSFKLYALFSSLPRA
ncbi:hypothetical protein MTR67_025282 [Solanum verrucosum]|uniref:NB-ARC domain-containing protein n=1 Tax=Solanum verrucosum TaxID=315347 RepID=A0AAF0TSZ8_SOLVR|nr:hypothetical protein MTR67_025282 [Solanum verrucosum]